jgi:hypothetical protein
MTDILPIEREIARALKIRIKDIMEWSTTEIKPHEGEELIHLKDLGVWVCYKKLVK